MSINKIAQRACVSLDFASTSRDFEGSDFFSPPTLGVASGGGFELWPKLMPIPVTKRGLLNVLIGLAQIWVLQVAPFPCKCKPGSAFISAISQQLVSTLSVQVASAQRMGNHLQYSVDKSLILFQVRDFS